VRAETRLSTGKLFLTLQTATMVQTTVAADSTAVPYTAVVHFAVLCDYGRSETALPKDDDFRRWAEQNTNNHNDEEVKGRVDSHFP
jgi:hypothetical protein